MSIFSEGLVGSSAMRLLDLECENIVSEENRKVAEKTRSESVRRESDSGGLSLVLS